MGIDGRIRATTPRASQVAVARLGGAVGLVVGLGSLVWGATVP
ncbi:MAG TPA: hypothetical protein VLV81_06445 [Acidimicrobiia bacterium]|nr:hypothetical protein [Acidimicrobiia bacterium]